MASTQPQSQIQQTPVTSAQSAVATPQGVICYHCGQPLPPGNVVSVTIQGEARPMCCQGCAAVARAICDGGLGDFYRHRTALSPTAAKLDGDAERETAFYDHPELQREFVRVCTDGSREVSLLLEGVACAACMWLNECHIGALPGVLEVQVNYTTHRARVRWDDDRIHLSRIINAIAAIGYRARPYDPRRQEQVLARMRRDQLRRLGVAGALGMQVMILSVALYGGAWWGIETEFRQLFRWLGLALTLPIVGYCAQPFFASAWRDLKNRRAGMDVPVALAISIAFVTSAWATVTDAGEVYYDSVVMFVFFLLSARYFELAARKRTVDIADALTQRAPATAVRIAAETNEQTVIPIGLLRPGDRVMIRPGDTVPADGCVQEGRSSVDESLLTGESVPVSKSFGHMLVGGSINIESPLVMQVEQTGVHTRLAGIARLLERAQSERPQIAQVADRIAGWFIGAVLALTAVVAIYWWRTDAPLALPIVIALLVVTCPCALSLATPAAVTATVGRLMRLGLLVTRGYALETLARATHFVFDKTGTLTKGRVRVVEIRVFADLTQDQCLQIAASLERHSEHPFAKALVAAAGETTGLPTTAPRSLPGGGVSGDIDGRRYFLGSPRFVYTQTGARLPEHTLASLQQSAHSVVMLAWRETLYAAFVLADELRAGARELVAQLHASRRTVLLLTGDHERAARSVAAQVGIEQFAFELTPEDKLERVRALQREGAIVAMIGDGVNDAPVLAQAQVAIAVGSDTAITAAAADIILLSGELPQLTNGIDAARKMLHIIRQNFAWALAYNLVALPAAALGFVAPWLAALGMSASSLLVVTNALRLADRRSKQAVRNKASVLARSSG
jgi:Cu2+-exporting ATPase